MNDNPQKAIIGVDVGGTHCDGVLVDSLSKNIINHHKVLINTGDKQNGVLTLIQQLVQPYSSLQIERIVLSTTLVTNALSYHQKPHLGAFLISSVGINPNELDLDIPIYNTTKGYVNHMGQLLTDLDPKELHAAKTYFEELGIKMIVVVQKFSTRNPILEKNAIEYFQSFGFEVFGSSNLSGDLNFPRRAYTGIFNAQASHLFKDSIHNLEQEIHRLGINAPLFLLKTDGGHISLGHALEYPIETILSGPSASVTGALSILQKDYPERQNETVLTIDIGGTTTDLGLVHNEQILVKNQVSLFNKPVLVEGIFSHPIALGGDTKINIKDQEILYNRRKDIALLFGGQYATCTDFFEAFYYHNGHHKIVLENYFQISSQELSRMFDRLKKQVFELINQNIEIFLEQAGIKPVFTIKDFKMSQEKVVPSCILLVGAASYYFKPLFEEYYSKYQILLPTHFYITNAIGSAFSMPSYTLSLSYSPLLKVLYIPEIDFSANHSSLTLKDAVAIITTQFIKSYHSSYKDDLKEEDIQIYNIECFAIIQGYRKIGDTIRLKAKRKLALIE